MVSNDNDKPDSALMPVAAPIPGAGYPDLVPHLRASQGPAVSLGTLWRAFRRRWLLAVMLGMVLGSATGIALWYLRTPQYTAVALLVIPQAPPRVLPSNDPRSGEEKNYQKTQ